MINNQPHTEFVGTDKHPKWKLLEDYTRQLITVPTGFIYDKASVPRIFWALMPPDGLYGGAACIHDWIYHNHGILKDGRVFTKEMADELFYKIMLLDGVNKIKAKTMYLAVKWFGQKKWND